MEGSMQSGAGRNVYLRRLWAPLGGAATLVLVGMAFLTATASAATATPVVETARAVTGGFNPTRIYQSPSIAVDPANPNTVALVATNYHYPGGCSAYVSRDGGLSWGPGVSVLPAGTQFCGLRPIAGRLVDPVFANNGTLYVGLGAAAGQGYPNDAAGAFLTRSSDFGLTTQTATVQATHMVGSSMKMGKGSMGGMGANSAMGTGMTQARGVSVAVDPSNASNVYMGWMLSTTTPNGFKGSISPSFSVLGHETSFASVSHDGGRTWSTPVNLTAMYGKPTLGSGDGTEAPQMLAGGGGTVYAIADTTPANTKLANKLMLFKSTNRGSTWTSSVIPFNTPVQYGSITEPQAAIDPHTGEIYVTGDVQIGKPGTFSGPNEVYVTHSTDGGRTWSAPVNVVDPAARGSYDQYDPGISVAPNGRVDIAWIDFRSDPYYKLGASGKAAPGSSSSERYYDIYAAYSTDHGTTWSKNIRVSNQTIDANLGAEFPDFAVLSVGVASTNARMFVAWGNPVAGAPPATPEDAFVNSVDFAPTATATTSTTTSSGTKAAWAIIGAGIALVLAGLFLVFTLRQPQTRPAQQKEKVGSGASSD